MSGRRWTEEEIEFLKENYEKEKPEKIAEELSRSLSSVYCKAQSLNLSSKRCGYGRKWTSEEEKYLKENYSELPPQKIADELDRSLNSVYGKAKNLDLKSSRRGSGEKKMVFRRNRIS